MQTALFEKSQLTNGFRDPAFTKNRDLPLHRWVPWVAGFSAQFVQDCLNKYLPARRRKSPWVLDPFAGVGTTLVESYFRGVNVLGFEINPYAALAADVKLRAAEINPDVLRRFIGAFEIFMEHQCGLNAKSKHEPKSAPPLGFSGRTQLFSPKVERKVLFALDFITLIGNRNIRDLFRLALGSVMVSFSNYSYEPSLTRRVAAGKLEITDALVEKVIAAKLRLMLEDIEWAQDLTRQIPDKHRAQVIDGSFFTAREKAKRERFVDLVITSPPYLNNYHYPRNTRPQLHWLGLANGKGYAGAGEADSFGKFWQTVRGLPPVELTFPLSKLEKKIQTIRGLNIEGGSYGGPGWANYVVTYFNDVDRFCKTLSTLMRSGGKAIIVLGNSIIQGVDIQTDKLFGEIAERHGFTFAESITLREKRTGSSIIRSSVRVAHPAARTVLYEAAVVLEF